MRVDLINLKPIYSSFLLCDQDVEKILKTLFVLSKPHSDILKRLLLINSKDCLDVSKVNYQKLIDSYSLSKMIDEGYIRLSPKIPRSDHENIKTYIVVTIDNFTPNSSSVHYMDYNINFNVVCYNDAFVLNNYRVRPLMICGYIDGILNSLTQDKYFQSQSHQSQIKLSGTGEYDMLGCVMNIPNEDFAMYTLSYRGTHFTEDIKKIGNVNAE